MIARQENRMTTFSDIIDNRQLNLKDEINDKLDGSERVKFAVGYLYLSGFYHIAEKMENLEEVKLLIGSNLNRDLTEALAETLPGDEDIASVVEQNTHQRPADRDKTKKKIGNSVIRNVQALPHTVRRQKEITKLVELVRGGKVHIKVYTKHTLHAKAYIFKYKQDIASAAAAEGIGIIGSSNLTMSGFHHNTELNTYVRGQKNYKELNEWFDRLWDEASEFEESMIDILEQSWALKTVNPYDIFILTLYHLSKSTIDKQTSQIWFWENEDYMERLVSLFEKMKNLYSFQKVAIMQAYEWIQQYEGVFIADVVGLGKTFIGAGLLKQLNRRALVIAPPGLVEMWEEFLEKFAIDGKVVSRGMLYRGVYDRESSLWPYRERDIVLIDESHHFRNNDTKMYRELQPFLASKKVILMTATPQNTSPWNIYNQLKLFHQTEENVFPNRYEEPHLRNLFRKVERGDYRLQEFLKYILIRRTRNHIKRFYVDSDLDITFPKRQLNTATYDINDTYYQFYDKIRLTLQELTYARYDLWEYVLPDKKEVEPYSQLKKVIGTLRVFHKINLFKRLESSIYAFRKSIENLLNIHQKFLTIIEEKNIVPAGELIQDRIYRYELEDIWDQIEELAGDYQSVDFDLEHLVIDLQKDIAIFQQVHSDLQTIPIERDSKYDALVTQIDQLRENSMQEKILIFSEYADTVDYLYSRMKEGYENTDKAHGGTSGNAHKIEAFAPEANSYKGDDVIQLMVASDVLSEGHNLQDCSAIINYDLHWNPVRLIQRAGRVDRIGSEAETIYIRNFLPVDEVEREINIQHILERRIREIHDHIGEDEQILTEEEQVNNAAMYTIYDKRDMEELEKQDQIEFTLDEAETVIRDLMRTKPEYMALIKKMQLGLRSAKRASISQGTYAFFRAGDFVKLFLRKTDGTIIENFSEVLKEIRCSPEEEEQQTSHDQVESYYSNLEKLKDHFSRQLSVENLNVRIDPVVRRSKQRLQEIVNSKASRSELLESASKIDSTLNSYFPHHLVGELRRINKEEETLFFEEIVNLYNRENLGDLSSSKEDREPQTTEFMCGEILT